MKVRMLFGTRSENGKEDLNVGEIRDVSTKFGKQLIAEGRAEPEFPEKVENRDPRAGQ